MYRLWFGKACFVVGCWHLGLLMLTLRGFSVCFVSRTRCFIKHVIKAISEVDFDRVAVPVVELRNLFDDGCNPIARDGAAILEVGIRLQKALASLAALDDAAMQACAIAQVQVVIAHAQNALKVPQELAKLNAAFSWPR